MHDNFSYLTRQEPEAHRIASKRAVVTDHAPSPRSVRPWFRTDSLNPAFASHLDRLNGRYQPVLWIHSHMRDPVDEYLGRTRVVANPAGRTYHRRPCDQGCGTRSTPATLDRFVG